MEPASRSTARSCPASSFLDPDPSLQAFDPVKAKKLLADLGWKDTDNDWVLEKGGQELSIQVLADKGDTVKEAAANRLQWQLLQAGIKVEFEFLPIQQLFGERLIPGKFQAVFMQSNALGDPDQLLSAFWHSSSIGRSNLSGYRNPEVDRLIDLGRATSDPGRRRKSTGPSTGSWPPRHPLPSCSSRSAFQPRARAIGGVAASIGSFYNLSSKIGFS